MHNKYRKILLVYYFIRLCRILSMVFHQFPTCTDRYMDLWPEINDFLESGGRCGLSNVIVVGAFEIGMESFLLSILSNFTFKIFMNRDRREFLEQMETGDDSESNVQKIRRQIVDKRIHALIHVVDVDAISEEVCSFVR